MTASVLPLASIIVAIHVLCSRGFHDDDCELVEGGVVVWSKFRTDIASAKHEIDSQTVRTVLQNKDLAAKECPLGLIAACLSASPPEEAPSCLEDVSFERMLATRWPLFWLLALRQAEWQGERTSGCDDVYHPSLNWSDWRAHAETVAPAVVPWIMGLNEDDHVPEDFQTAMSYAEGIIWKASSAAVTQGHTVSWWTDNCREGVLSAHAVRDIGLILSDGDIYRVLERSLSGLEQVVRSMDNIMASAWPLFDLLHAVSLCKKTLHDLHFAPEDLLPLPSDQDSGPIRSPIWQKAAKQIKMAGARGTVLLTSLPHTRINFLYPFLKRAHNFDFVGRLMIIPQKANVSEPCENIAEMFHSVIQPDLPHDWSPCLPFASQFYAKAQYLYMLVALQLGIGVLWFDFNVFWVTSPVAWLDGPKGAPPYHHNCRARCPAAEPDLFVAEEFYAEHLVRPGILYARPTATVKSWIEVLLRWLCTFPFANPKRGLQYLAQPNLPDVVPSVTKLPKQKDIPRVQLGELDVEQQFVSTDGWFGHAEGIIAFELSPMLNENDKVLMLDTMYGSSEAKTKGVLMMARKTISPKRPTSELIQRFQAEADGVGECPWQDIGDAYLGGYALGVEDIYSLHEARCECLQMGSECRGVTCEGESCSLRQGDPFLATSPAGEVSHIKLCTGGGCDVPEVKRIVHVNFADGCCEKDQKQSSDTALQFGTDETRPLRGDFLDDEFRLKNKVLLEYNRTPELTQHKTPTGKIGYYVWKPYVVMKTLEDPSLDWDTTVVVYTDAGIHFVGDVRPLIEKYLRSSDVAATRTPMHEGDFSKRDAFVLLDADYLSIMETNQVATGIILLRKTPLAIEFAKAWLKACEEPRIMTEEPSELGFPEYFTFKNNNDDQTAFSLLFKKRGFNAFSVGERDAVVYTGRNLAKFIKASDDFAIGRQGSQDSYLEAADAAAICQTASGAACSESSTQI